VKVQYPDNTAPPTTDQTVNTIVARAIVDGPLFKGVFTFTAYEGVPGVQIAVNITKFTIPSYPDVHWWVMGPQFTADTCANPLAIDLNDDQANDELGTPLGYGGGIYGLGSVPYCNLASLETCEFGMIDRYTGNLQQGYGVNHAQIAYFYDPLLTLTNDLDPSSLSILGNYLAIFTYRPSYVEDNQLFPDRFEKVACGLIELVSDDQQTLSYGGPSGYY